MRWLSAGVVIGLLGVGCASQPAAVSDHRPDPAPPLVAQRYELRHMSDGGLYRFDTATGELCYMQNWDSVKASLLSPTVFQAQLRAPMTPAERKAWVADTAMAGAEDCES